MPLKFLQAEFQVLAEHGTSRWSVEDFLLVLGIIFVFTNFIATRDRCNSFSTFASLPQGLGTVSFA